MLSLSAKDLTKTYRHRTVVNHISLQVQTGEIVGLLGPNGAGKTTCFYLIVGLIQPDGGRIFFDERNITALTIDQRAKLGISYLPQEASIFRKLSVSQNIEAILELRPELSAAARQQQLEKLLDEFHLQSIREQMGYSLSGGERRRVEIARALATDPKFILLDEPFAGVDPISVVDIKKLVTQLRDRNIGVLMTDHNVRETLTICERAYIVNQGGILCHGTPQEILDNTAVRAVYLGEDFKF